MTPKTSRLSLFAKKAARQISRQDFRPVLCALTMFGLSVASHAQQTTTTPSPSLTTASSTSTATPVASPAIPDEMAATIVSVAPLVPEAAEEWDSDEAQAVAISDTEKRLIHARSLAAIGNYAGAIQQLETMRGANTDAAIANVARVLLTSIYIEQADYKRATVLLGEAFNLRATGGESGTRTYYAVAGQVLNGVRARLAHYRAYNVDIADRRLLPIEANNDLEGLRLLLDALVVQARTLQVQAGTQVTMHTDVAALFEDAAGVCLTLARNNKERVEWQRQLSDARQRLVAADGRWQGNRADGSQRPTTARNLPPPRPPVALGFAAPSKPAPETANVKAAKPTGGLTTADKSWSASSSPATPPATAESATNVEAITKPLAPPATVSTQIVEVGQLALKATQKIQPVYPPAARNARVAGIVTVVLVVNEKGYVESARSTSGPEMLRRAAEDAARRWRFRQPLNGNQSGRVSGYISFNFKL